MDKKFFQHSATFYAKYGPKFATMIAKIAIQSARLPGIIHGDPADRFLVATAHEENAVLVTYDEKLLAYGEDKFISVHDPRQGVVQQ